MPQSIVFGAEDVSSDTKPITFGAEDVGSSTDSPLLKYQGPFTSVIPKKRQAQVVGAIAGHDVPAAPESDEKLPGIVESIKASATNPATYAESLGRTALEFTSLPALYRMLKADVEYGPDIVRGLVNHPVETIRGAAAGTAEGAMELLSPGNAVLAMLGKIRGVGKRPAPPPAELPPAPRVTKAPTLEQSLVDALNEVRQAPTPARTSLPTRPQPVATASAAETRARQAVQGRAVPPDVPVAGTTAPILGKAATGIERRVADVPLAEGVTDRRAAALVSKYGGKAPVDTAEIARKSAANGRAVEEAFAEMMSAKGATVNAAVEPLLKAGKVGAAATTIEKNVVQSVTEIARDLRRAYGSGRAGEMLKGGAEQIKRLAPGPSRRPLVAEVDDLEREFQRLIASERGGISPKLAGAVGGGAAGAAYGAATGEDTEERIKRGALFGAGGALVVPFIAHAAAVGAPKAMQNYLFTSVLSSPQSVLKAWSGAYGGAVAAAIEKTLAGNVRDGSAILRELFHPQSGKRFIEALRNPTTSSGMAQDAPTIVGRVFGAADAVARRAMQAGGVSVEDAPRFTLSGLPTSSAGQDVLGLLSRHFWIRLATSLFPRVGIQVVERGLERSPLGLVSKSLQTGGSKGERIVRAVGGPAAAISAYVGNEDVPDWAKPFVVALSGVYALPVGSGFAAAEAKERGKGAYEQAKAGLESFAGNLPLPQFGPAEALDPESRTAMLVPNIVRDIARARDPFERDTRGQTLGRTRAKIPGLRERLPVKGRNVNIAGRPNEDRSSAIKRFFSTSSKSAKPMKDVPERVVRELERFDISINVPSFERELSVGKRKIPVPPEAAERARTERRQYLIPQIEKLLDSPAYQRADDAGKKRRLEAVIDRAQQAGGQRVRARLIRTLREQGAFRVAR